jgi:hypothetical protein
MPLAQRGAVSIHGMVVAWSCIGLGEDPVARLLARFPAIDGPFVPDLTFAFEPAIEECGTHPTLEGYRQTCYFDNVKGFSRESDFLLWDGSSRVHVDSRGSQITGAVAARSLTNLHQFTSIMLFIALIVALRHRQLFHIHAAVLVHPHGAGWLIVGGSGAGKTTSTLSLLTSGFGYLGDDATLLRLSHSSVEALSIPREFHLTDATMTAFPQLGSYTGERILEGHTKCKMDPSKAFPGAFRSSILEPKLVLFPEVTGSTRTEILAMPAADALGQLLAASVIIAVDQMPYPQEHLALLGTLLRHTRSFRLRLGQDVLKHPHLLRERIEEAL